MPEAAERPSASNESKLCGAISTERRPPSLAPILSNFDQIVGPILLRLNEDRRFQHRSDGATDKTRRSIGFCKGDRIMSLGLILVIVLVIFLLGGFSGRFGGYGYGFGHGGIGVIGIILIIIVVLLVMGRL
jgi:hypothetical protein